MNKVILVILDGWGYAPPWGGNATSLANTPNLDNYWRKYPHTILAASGEAVGLPGHEQGNSEVGHLNIGTGRVVYQDSSKISNSIKDGSFFKNETLLEAINHVKKNKSKIHFMGLLTNVATHAHINHLFALLDLAKKQELTDVYLHLFTDGRDSDPMDALQLVSRVERKITEIGVGKIATISGRYYAMDRDSHWERIQLTYNTLVFSKGRVSDTPLKAISTSYQENRLDEFILPTTILEKNKPVARVSSNDSLIFFNFRSDRAKQLTLSFTEDNFKYFPRNSKIKNLFFAGMIPYGYEKELDGNLHSVFSAENIPNSLAEVLSKKKLKQFHLAETEKYAHVTYFFNGGKEDLFLGEDRIAIPSPSVSTYDLQPEMSAEKITKELINKINKQYHFIVVNYANGDMVGHTGNLKAAINACETVDGCLGQVVSAALKQNYLILVTADHGNCEEMIDPKSGRVNTEHSRNPVPFFIITPESYKVGSLHSEGILADVAPTILALMNLEKPPDMTGKSLAEVETLSQIS